MSKRIVVSFPGGRGNEIPLLYFGAKHFEDMGYDKLFINHPISNDFSLDNVLRNALDTLRNINWAEYEHIVFIAKSLGTIVACNVKELLQIPATLILFTPLEGTVKYINKENDVLFVAMGDKDKYLSSTLLEQHCNDNDIKCHIEQDVGHRMEVMSDLQRNLEIVFNIIRHLD